MPRSKPCPITDFAQPTNPQSLLKNVRQDNLKHTAAFRLALGKTIPNLQASWVKMGLDAATEALRWGVNDLGGTLMEESISRLAGSYHGTRLDPPPRWPSRRWSFSSCGTNGSSG